MASLVEQLAEQLAKDAMALAAQTGDDTVIDDIAKSLADTSTTFQELYLTCIRYLRADERARVLLPGQQSGIALPPPEKEATPPASRPAPVEDETPSNTAPADKEVKEPTPSDEEDIPYAEAEIVDDADNDNPFAKPSGHVGTGRLVPKPQILPEDAETPASEPEVTGPRKSGR